MSLRGTLLCQKVALRAAAGRPRRPGKAALQPTAQLTHCPYFYSCNASSETAGRWYHTRLSNGNRLATGGSTHRSNHQLESLPLAALCPGRAGASPQALPQRVQSNRAQRKLAVPAQQCIQTVTTSPRGPGTLVTTELHSAALQPFTGTVPLWAYPLPSPAPIVMSTKSV